LGERRNEAKGEDTMGIKEEAEELTDNVPRKVIE